MTVIRCCFVLTTSLIAFAAFADDAPPSDASILGAEYVFAQS